MKNALGNILGRVVAAFIMASVAQYLGLSKDTVWLTTMIIMWSTILEN